MGTSLCKTGSTQKTQIPRMQHSSDELLTKEVAFYWFLFNYEDFVALDGFFIVLIAHV